MMLVEAGMVVTTPLLLPHALEMIHVLTKLGVPKRMGDMPVIVGDLERRDSLALSYPVEDVAVMPFRQLEDLTRLIDTRELTEEGARQEMAHVVGDNAALAVVRMSIDVRKRRCAWGQPIEDGLRHRLEGDRISIQPHHVIAVCDIGQDEVEREHLLGEPERILAIVVACLLRPEVCDLRALAKTMGDRVVLMLLPERYGRLAGVEVPELDQGTLAQDRLRQVQAVLTDDVELHVQGPELIEGCEELLAVLGVASRRATGDNSERHADSPLLRPTLPCLRANVVGVVPQTLPI